MIALGLINCARCFCYDIQGKVIGEDIKIVIAENKLVLPIKNKQIIIPCFNILISNEIIKNRDSAINYIYCIRFTANSTQEYFIGELKLDLEDEIPHLIFSEYQ